MAELSGEYIGGRVWDNLYAPRQLEPGDATGIHKKLPRLSDHSCEVPGCERPAMGWNVRCEQYLCSHHHGINGAAERPRRVRNLHPAAVL